jgi:parvulin-like peptidyl-prolyl isomerase
MLENVKKMFASEDKFKQALEEQGLTVGLLSKRLEDQARIKRLVEQEVKLRVSVDVEEARRYYEANKDKFFHGMQYRLQHILIKNIPGKESEAEARAQEALIKIKGGADFSLVAKEYSEDPNASVGGDLGFMDKDELMPEMREAVEPLKAGEVSGIIKTRLGYEIIKVRAIKEASAKSFDEVKVEITQKLFQEKFASAYNNWLAGLKKNSYIHINKEAF